MNDYAHLKLHEATVRGTRSSHHRPRTRRRRRGVRRFLRASARPAGIKALGPAPSA